MASASAGKGGWRPVRMCWAAAGLLIPAVLFYAANAVVAVREGKIPTPYVHRDMAYYMANAREYLDAGTPWIAYGNPFSPDADTPRIYFQPWTLVLAIVWQLTDAPPGLIFLGFGIASAWSCAYLALRLFADRFGLASTAQRVVAVCFFWGGGVLSLAGIVLTPMTGDGFTAAALRFDPEDGYWLLNLGRNIIFPTEAFYHAMVLGLAILVHRRRYAWALGVTAILFASHPFTGIEFALIVVVWAATERLLLRREDAPKFLLPGAAVIALAGIGYYLLFLPRFPEHAVLMQQWRLAWVLPWHTQLLADGPLVVWVIREFADRRRLARTLGDPFQRFVLVWFGVVLLLEHHDMFITPHQPIHFARGYSWIPLFLLAAPQLIRFFQRFSWRSILGGAFLLLTLSDNLIWLNVSVRHYHAQVTLNEDSKEVLDWLQQNVREQELLVSQDSRLAYFATVYSPVRAWHSHFANTPHARQRRLELEAFFAEHTVPPAWQGRTALVLFDLTRPAGAQRVQAADQVLLSNRKYTLVRRRFADARTGPAPECRGARSPSGRPTLAMSFTACYVRGD